MQAGSNSASVLPTSSDGEVTLHYQTLHYQNYQTLHYQTFQTVVTAASDREVTPVCWSSCHSVERDHN